MRQMSKEQRRAAFLETAEGLFEAMEEWYDVHPDATFGEIEAELRRQRRRMMAEAQAILVNGRSTGHQAEPPACPGCGRAMRFEGYGRRQVRSLEGDVELERVYYRCPHGCGESLFPPGPDSEVAQ